MVDVRTTLPSSGYTGASGGGNVLFSAAAGGVLYVNNIAVCGAQNLVLSFGTNQTSEIISAAYRISGTNNWIEIPFNKTTTTWGLVDNLKITLPAGTNTINLRFTALPVAFGARIDDISIITYDKTGIPIVDPDIIDLGVIISGIRWATRNVDIPGTFAPTPESAGMFYQWNRRTGWSVTDPMINSNGGTVWDNSTPTGTYWTRANDPCPVGWRVPTQAELQSLINTGSTWTSRNDVDGRLFGWGPNQIFLPAVGVRNLNTGSLWHVGTGGRYLSSTQSGFERAWRLWFHYDAIGTNTDYRARGFSIRCVAEN